MRGRRRENVLEREQKQRRKKGRKNERNGGGSMQSEERVKEKQWKPNKTVIKRINKKLRESESVQSREWRA